MPSMIAQGGVAPYLWSIQSGAPPMGLTLGANGVWGGTPSAGTGNTTALLGIKLLDAAGGIVTRNFSLYVASPPVVGGSLNIRPQIVGYGAQTRGAYGLPGVDPVIIPVTSLADSGPGTLRDALEGDFLPPRVVIFMISGTIVLLSDISIKSPYFTIAGQTAPSPGIAVRGDLNASVSAGGIICYTHDGYFGHFRIRPGDGGPTLPQTQAHDALLLYTYAGFSQVCYNIVLDHMSISWAPGKNLNIVSNGPGITVHKCLIAEPLFRSRAISDTWANGNPSGLGTLIAPNVGVTINRSAWVSCPARTPEIHDGCDVQIINCLDYNYGQGNGDPLQTQYPYGTFWYVGSVAEQQARGGSGFAPTNTAIVGTKYITGPGPYRYAPLTAIYSWSVNPGSQTYLHDNLVDTGAFASALFDFNAAGFDPRVGSSPSDLSAFTIIAASSVEATIMPDVGARPLDQDAVDARLCADVAMRRSYGPIASQNEVDAWPSLGVHGGSFVVPANPHVDAGGGYTNLEVSIEAAAVALEP